MKETKKNTKNNKRSILKKFAASRGFYIALCSLAVIVGISIYARYVQSDINTEVASFDDEAWKAAVEESGIRVVDVDDSEKTADSANAEANTEKAENSLSASVNAENAENTDAVAASAIPQKRTETPKFSMKAPCDGEVIAECFIDELVYCSTMEDWRTHNGMDFAAEIGDAVLAAADGTVSKVYEDELLGVVVVVDHENGISSVYGNLQSYDFIRVGTEVKQGDIVGGVGKPGALEADKEPHLHFEVMADGEHKNPKEYLGG